MTDFQSLLRYMLLFFVAAAIGFFLIARSKRMLLQIKPELLRRNVVTFIIGLCFYFALGHLMPDFWNIMRHFGWGKGILLSCIVVISNVLIPYNIVLFITESGRFSSMNFMKQQVLIFFCMVVSTIITNGLLNFWINEGSTRYLKFSMLWSFSLSGFGSLAYLFIRQYEMDKSRKLAEKELELARLNELKTKAELEALHSKINPHFLYNALNSIADLSVSDGKKGRQMTIALADLFRKSMNYSRSNFATVKDEIETVKLYLEIEKTRFEDQLTYSIQVDEEARQLLVPTFILQPIIENAVKHGLKLTSQLTEIRIEIRFDNENLLINVYDNGPAFPSQINPGYGLKSVYDKLELLFPGRFEIQMINSPQKHFSIKLQNPVNEV